MLFIGSKLKDIPLLSVRSSGQVGLATSAIINPNNLHIDGFYAHAMNNQNNGIIVDIDVREFTLSGIIIDDHEDITNPEDLVRLKPVIDINFQLINKAVFQNKRKIGKVIDYAFESNSLFIQTLYVQSSIMSGFGSKELQINRQQIIEINDDRIVISGGENKSLVGQLKSTVLPSSSASSSAMSE